MTVTSGQGYIASLDRGGTLALSAAPTTNALSAEASDSSNDNRISQNSTTSSTEASPLSNILNGTSGNDLIRLGAVDLGANAGEGGDKVVGNNFNNVLDGGSGNDTIFGHDGDDTIITGNGEDRIDGGDGIDTVVYADRLLANSSVQKVGKVITVDNTDTLTNVEFVQFSDTRISTENLQAVPVLKGSDLTFTEGNSSNTIARFTFNLSAPAPVDVQFSYNTLEGTALAGSDYIATSGQVTIAAGESSATIEVEVIGDTEFEPAEVFALSLSGLSGATFENNEAEYIVVANVENDDPLNTPPSTTGIGDITVTENAPNSIVDLFAAFEDAEESDAALTYSIEGNTNNGVFDSVTIDGVTGTLTLDYADKAISNADLTVRATDSEGKFVDTTFTVSVIAAGNGKDVLFGSNGNDYLDGGNGKDEIFGLGGNDRLIGGNSNDLLRGGEGNDLLKGGNGKDVFVLAVGEGTDIIEDFKSRNDSLGLAGSLTFRQLTIGQENDNTLVSLTESGEVLAILNGINSSSIGSKDFTYAI